VARGRVGRQKEQGQERQMHDTELLPKLNPPVIQDMMPVLLSSLEPLTVRLSETRLDGLLEPADDGDHTALVGDKAEAAGVRVVESGGPRADDTAVDRVVLAESAQLEDGSGRYSLPGT
jgi:hypothetical protein